MKTKRILPSALVVPALLAAAVAAARGESWVYDNGYITNSLGWKIQVNKPAAGTTALATIDNGMVKGWPAAGDRADGLYTLDLSQPIVDAADPAKTYALETIGYYEFNGSCAVGTLVLPGTLRTWKFNGTSVPVCGRGGANIDTILPTDFSKDVVWSGGATDFGWGAKGYSGELHLRGVQKTGNVGLGHTHGGIQRVFFDDGFLNFHSTTFANSGSTRFDLYFRDDPPGGTADTSFSPGARALLHVPAGNAAWAAWLESNARAFAETDRATFAAQFPDEPDPDFVVSAAGKFKNGYVRLWHAAPGLEVASPYPIAADRVSPTYGTYTDRKTGDEVALSCPASVTEDGVEYLCRGYRLERTSGADWAAGTTVESTDLSLSVVCDTAEAVRVTWLWEPQVTASVTVTSNRGAFGPVDPGYGLCLSFPGGARTFSATGPGYDAAARTRFRATGYRLTDESGTTTEHAGTSFEYDTSMGKVVLEWLWTADGYALRTSAPGCLPVAVSPALDAEGYGDIGAAYALAAPSGEGEAAFAHWSGNVSAIASDTARTVSATLSRPLTLVAEPRCAWRYDAAANPTSITNALGWRIGGSVSGANFRVGQRCVISPASVAWDLDEDKHWLDLSLPVVKGSDGSALTIDGCGSNIPFRRFDGDPRLGKLVLGDAFRRWPFDGNAIFDSQDRLAEIEPAILTDDAVSSFGSGEPSFGAIPYRGDVFLRCAPATRLNNCNLVFTHRGTQNVFVGTNLVTFSSTAFSWSYANYRLHFDGFPTGLAASRNTSGDYRFYVFYRSNDVRWADYLAANARRFAAADRDDFAARFPEDAAAGKWPYFSFTSGFFSGTWARPLYPTGTVLIVK